LGYKGKGKEEGILQILFCISFVAFTQKDYWEMEKINQMDILKLKTENCYLDTSLGILNIFVRLYYIIVLNFNYW